MDLQTIPQRCKNYFDAFSGGIVPVTKPNIEVWKFIQTTFKKVNYHIANALIQKQ